MRDTIDMAETISHGWWLDDEKLKAFADLVRSDERNRAWTQEHWTEYERSIVAAERERVLKILEDQGTWAHVGDLIELVKGNT